MAPKPATRASPRNQVAKGASDAAAPEQSVPASSASSQKATTHGKKRLAVAGGGEVPPGVPVWGLLVLFFCIFYDK